MISILLLIPWLWYENNFSFLDQAQRERNQGAEWHYVGTQEPDPDAESITLQCVDPDTGEPCGERYILWKLKKK